MFENIESLQNGLKGVQYIANRDIASIVYLAEKLEKPVLLEGPAGVGKTELAKAVAQATGRELIRLQCYEGLDETRALYEWEYAKQLLYTQLLRDKLTDVFAGTDSLAEAANRLAQEEDVFFSMRFLLQRPLLKAILSEQPTVLLIDEIDRADAEFEAFLLELLSDFQVSVPEIGTLTAVHKPLVFLTSNNTRELSEALKRRCLFQYIGYPTREREIEIVRLKVPGMEHKMASAVVEFVQGLRKADLRKIPSVAETLDWARALMSMSVNALDPRVARQTMGVLVKHEQDMERAELAAGMIQRSY